MNSVVGYAELPEYRAVKAAKDAIQADEQASKIFADYLAFQQEIQVMAQNGTNARRPFPRKDAVFQQNKSKRTLFCQISLPNSNNCPFIFRTLKKLSLNLFPELLK